MSRKFEYKVVGLAAMGANSTSENILNKLGSEGWELVSTYIKDGFINTQPAAYLKREIKPKVALFKRQYSSSDELLKAHTCGDCWIENETSNGVELGCEKCNNDAKFFDFERFIPLE